MKSELSSDEPFRTYPTAHNDMKKEANLLGSASFSLWRLVGLFTSQSAVRFVAEFCKLFGLREQISGFFGEGLQQ